MIPDRQDETRVGDLQDIGLARCKLSIIRAGTDAVLDDRFDPAQGFNNSAKNAKAFLHGVVHGTMNRFAGVDELSKKTAFLAALNVALNAHAEPLELDIKTCGFNPSLTVRGNQITEASDIFFAAIAPIDPRENLLRQAHALGISGRNAEGESVYDLLSELSFAQGAYHQAVLAKVEAANFGIGCDKTLADMVAARLADHALGGRYHDLGLGGDEARIAAFHYHLEQAQREAVAAVTVAPEDHEMICLGQGLRICLMMAYLRGQQIVLMECLRIFLNYPSE
jgi:hypothetical protein